MTRYKILHTFKGSQDGIASEEFVAGTVREISKHLSDAVQGTGWIAPVACVPMRQEEHLLQHQRGEAACLEAYLGGKWTVEAAKAWFDAQVAKKKGK